MGEIPNAVELNQLGEEQSGDVANAALGLLFTTGWRQNRDSSVFSAHGKYSWEGVYLPEY